MTAILKDDIFSDGYLDEFYRTHIAPNGGGGGGSSRRNNTTASLDDDIAAIEAEINKVHEYRHKFRRYRVMVRGGGGEQGVQAAGQGSDSGTCGQLNSCGNSECSDDDDSDNSLDMEMLPTSVFRIYNSTSGSINNNNNNTATINNNSVFSWAEYQLVSHDHSYSSQSLNNSVYIVQDSLTLQHIKWNTLNVSKRVTALKRLIAILQNKPITTTNSLSPSLFYLPQSFADLLRNNNGILPLNKGSSVDKDVIIKLSRDSLAKSLITAATSIKNKKKASRYTPYDRKPIEITRVRYSCSESENPLEVD